MKTFVVVPTYNESENIEILINKILDLDIKDLHILVVDDNSPDGTGDIAEGHSHKDSRVLLLRRLKEKGH